MFSSHGSTYGRSFAHCDATREMSRVAGVALARQRCSESGGDELWDWGTRVLNFCFNQSNDIDFGFFLCLYKERAFVVFSVSSIAIPE